MIKPRCKVPNTEAAEPGSAKCRCRIRACLVREKVGAILYASLCMRRKHPTDLLDEEWAFLKVVSRHRSRSGSRAPSPARHLRRDMLEGTGAIVVHDRIRVNGIDRRCRGSINPSPVESAREGSMTLT